MDYIKIRFGSDFGDFDSKFGKTIEDMFRNVNPIFALSEQAWKPQMDIYETSDTIYIIAEIAGVKKEDLEIEINKKAVRIFGQREEMPRIPNARYRLAEVQYGRFERVLFLPAYIDTDKVDATYKDGFLRIQLSKLQPGGPHKVPIS